MISKIYQRRISSLSILVALILCGTLVSPAFAVVANPTSFSEGIESVERIAKGSDLSEAKSAKEIMQSIVKSLLLLIATIATISLLYGGFLYITSQGEENKAEKAKNIILYSVIGLIIMGLSAIIVNVVISLTQL